MKNHIIFTTVDNDCDVLIERTSKHFKMPSMHSHDCYELYYMVSGERDYFVESNFFTVKTGQFALINRGQLHKTGGKGGERILISFTKEYLLKYFTPFAVDKLLTAFTRNHIEPESDVQEKLGDLFNNFFTYYENKDFDKLYPYIDELLTILIGSPTAISSSSLPSTHVNNIIDYVKNHFNEINGIEDVADKFYISKFYLCRTFKKLLGVSFISYLTQIKLKHALKLLTTTDLDVSEIAFECGFNSTSYFCNIFKKHFNTSPLAYKKITKS